MSEIRNLVCKEECLSVKSMIQKTLLKNKTILQATFEPKVNPGYIIKKSAPSELIEAIDTIIKGDVFLSPSISKVVVKEYFRKNRFDLDKNLYEELTDREREILQLIAEGNTTEEISSKLYISKNTVPTHRRNIMKKLDLHNVAELTKYAIQHGIISDS